MSDNIEGGRVSIPLERELDMLFDLAKDYLSSKEQCRIAPCNPEFLIQTLQHHAKTMRECQKELLRVSAEISECAFDTLFCGCGDGYKKGTSGYDFILDCGQCESCIVNI